MAATSKWFNSIWFNKIKSIELIIASAAHGRQYENKFMNSLNVNEWRRHIRHFIPFNCNSICLIWLCASGAFQQPITFIYLMKLNKMNEWLAALRKQWWLAIRFIQLNLWNKLNWNECYWRRHPIGKTHRIKFTLFLLWYWLIGTHLGFLFNSRLRYKLGI